MRRFIISALVLSAVTANAQQQQVGINTAEPKATLHVEAGASENKGVIIPRITAAEMKTMTTGLGADHHSMMTYLKEQMPTADRTGKLADVTEPGYYYYDNTTGVQKWRTFGGGEQDFKALPSSIPGLYNYITKGAGIGGNGTSLGTGHSNIGIGSNFTGFTNVSHLTGAGNLAMGNSVYYNSGGSMSGSSNIGIGQSLYFMQNGGDMQSSNNIAMGINLYQFEKANAQFTGAGNLAMGMNSFVLRNGDLAGTENIGIGKASFYMYNGTITSSAYNNIALGNGIFQLGNLSQPAVFSGHNNIGIGDRVFSMGWSGFTNTTLSGSYNMGMGFNALGSNVGGLTGDHNIALGYQAMYSNWGDVSGGNNIALGYRALYSNLNGYIGSNNIGIGEEALYNLSGNTGSNNIAIGYRAGYHLGNGNGNVFLGNQSIGTDTPNYPDNVIAIGNGISLSSTQQVDNVILLGHNDNIAYDMVKIGMGTYKPQAKLDVAGGVRVANDASACTSANEGTIRYDGTNFYGCTSSGWKQLNN